MTQRGQHDDPLAGALRHSLKIHSVPADADRCPSADLLASYFERSLPAAEAASWDTHFSGCVPCQEQLATLARIETAVGAGAQPANATWRFSFLNWRWLTAASAATVGALAIWVAVQTPPPPATLDMANRQPVSAREAIAPQVREAPAATVPGKGVDSAGASAAEPELASQKDTARVAKSAPSSEVLGLMAKNQDLPGQKQASDKTAVPAEAEEVASGFRADEKKKESSLAFEQDALQRRVEVAASADRMEPAKPTDAQKLQTLAGVERTAEPQRQPVTPTAALAPPAAGVQQQAAQQRADLPAAQLSPGVAASETRARKEVSRTQEAPPRMNEAPFRDTGRFARLPRPAFVASAGRVEWRFYKDGLIERYDERLKAGDPVPSPAALELLAASAPSEKICWAVGRAGVVLRTINMEPWQSIGSPSGEDLVSVEAQDALRVTVRTSTGKTYVTADAGRTWRTP